MRDLGDWKRFELFEREARTLAQLVHPAIPKDLDSFQTDEGGPRLYIVQELAPGRTLADSVAAGYHPDEATVRAIAVETPLMLAAASGHDDIVRQLLARGVDVNGKDRDSVTALQLATESKHPSTAVILREHGAK